MSRYSFGLCVCLCLALCCPSVSLAQDEEQIFSQDDAPPASVSVRGARSPSYPATAYWKVSAHMTLTAAVPGTHIQMLVPLSDDRQSILARRTSVEGVRYWEEADGLNLWGHWQVTTASGTAQQITYAYTVQITDARTALGEHPFPVQKPDPALERYLQPSELIQSDTPRIREQAWRLVREQTRVDRAVRALYQYTAAFLPPDERHFSTDALSVLDAQRGGRAGKTRALVALLRAVGIPARVVGGIRLGDTRRKRTTIYWAEARIGDSWVPMDPAAGYFAWLPNTYLALYRDDLPLLIHTRQVSVAYTFFIRQVTRSAALAVDRQERPDQGMSQHAMRDKSNHVHTVATYVDRPRASVVLINERALSQERVARLLAQAQAAQLNVTLLSTDAERYASRTPSLHYLVDSNLTLIREAQVVVINTTDTAGVDALLKQGGYGVTLKDQRLVVATGVPRPVASVLVSVLLRLLQPREILLVPYHPDLMKLWEIARASLSADTPLTASATRLNVPSVRLNADTLAGLGWWRSGVVNLWAQAVRAHVSLPALNFILVLPLIAFFLVIIRNVIGLETFGTFSPMLLALAFLTTGLGWGFLIFCIIVGLGGGLRFALQHFRLHLVSRVAILIAVVSVSMAGLTVLGAMLGIGALLRSSIFPMVIMANLIESFTNTQLERGTAEALRLTRNTLLVATCSYVGIENTGLKPLVLTFPEILMAVIGIELLLGRWRGLRVVEYVRFSRLLRQADIPPVAGANQAPTGATRPVPRQAGM